LYYFMVCGAPTKCPAVADTVAEVFLHVR
jgi:hypothetical protein